MKMMVDYNVQDIIVTEQVYLRMRIGKKKKKTDIVYGNGRLCRHNWKKRDFIIRISGKNLMLCVMLLLPGISSITVFLTLIF